MKKNLPPPPEKNSFISPIFFNGKISKSYFFVSDFLQLEFIPIEINKNKQYKPKFRTLRHLMLLIKNSLFISLWFIISSENTISPFLKISK